jgi:hypothetical protein
MIMDNKGANKMTTKRIYTVSGNGFDLAHYDDLETAKAAAHRWHARTGIDITIISRAVAQ